MAISMQIVRAFYIFFFCLRQIQDAMRFFVFLSFFLKKSLMFACSEIVGFNVLWNYIFII